MKSELKTEYKSRKARDSSESIVEMTRTLLTAIFLTLFSQTAWAEDASSPKLNDIIKKLESIENRLTNLEKRIPEASGIETFAKMVESLNSIGSSASNKVAITKNEERKVAGSDFLSIVSWSAKEEKSNGYSLGAILNLEYSVKNVSDKLIFELQWKKYDLVMLDNKRFMHGRRKFNFKEKRDILNIQTSKANFAYGATTRKVY